MLVAVAVAAAALTLPALAFAHLERPSYWPDPRPDRSVTPSAGGEVPRDRQRWLVSAVRGGGPGEVRVVCEGREGRISMKRMRQSVRSAKRRGFRIRPSQPKKELTGKRARRLLRFNRKFARQCEYRSIQQAIFDSGNNDRVVVMPGRYREARSRRQPTNDPRCENMTQENGSGEEAPSYRYQSSCPNDQNLIYIQGREVGEEPPPEPPLEEREGIPDLGPCVRCNLSLEGSGVKPQDVILDAGRNYRNPQRPGARPGATNGCDFEAECAYAKDVVLRVDRADGFIGRNFLTKSSTEHGVYVEETDGYLLNRTKFFWSGEYGNLTFTSDHGVYKHCDSFGAGDAAVYPGASPETGVDVEDKSFYPDAPRINTVVKKCDLRSSALAYSGSQGNAVRITRNEIYANTTGIVTDAFSASGHPGYPPDSVRVDHNNIYSNNLNSYRESPPFENTVGLPIGVGIMWPGVNSTVVRRNYIFDNWRRGSMLLAIPNAAASGEPEDPSRSACEKRPGPTQSPSAATSCENTHRANFMGQAPPGFKPSPAVGKFGNPSSLRGEQINGLDFWWDEYPGNDGNCWGRSNVGPDGTHASITSDPKHNTPAHVHGKNVPRSIPEECNPNDPTWPLGFGQGNPLKEAVLVNCAVARDDPQADVACDWFDPPPEPGSSEAARQKAAQERAAARFDRSEDAARIQENLQAFSTVAGRR